MDVCVRACVCVCVCVVGDKCSSYYRFVFAAKERDPMRLIVSSSNISHSCELCDPFCQ